MAPKTIFFSHRSPTSLRKRIFRISRAASALAIQVIGADGWMLTEPIQSGLRTRLFNSDGSEAEISGNGTRCAAALFLFEQGTERAEVTIETGAGPKHLRLISCRSNHFEFEMDMGAASRRRTTAAIIAQRQDVRRHDLERRQSPVCHLCGPASRRTGCLLRGRPNGTNGFHITPTFPSCVWLARAHWTFLFLSAARVRRAAPVPDRPARLSLLFSGDYRRVRLR